MHLRRNLHYGKRKYLVALILLFFISVISVSFTMDDIDDFDTSRREVLLRKIGDEILLQSGDKTSRVMPLKKIGESEYQISFENDLTFHPDSLVNTTRRLLVNDSHTRDYIVNVVNCGNSSVAYGYAISRDQKNDIIACKGRVQPRACYLINIKFKQSGSNRARNGLLLGSLPLLAFLGYVFLRSGRAKKVLPESESTGMFTLGSVLFDAKSRKLISNEKSTDLTGTETRVLRIFALSPNEIIERSRLQKEIWEDEGVIVGRSLDMFISKLRKKLEVDPDVKIVVVRGKGYRLEVGYQK